MDGFTRTILILATVFTACCVFSLIFSVNRIENYVNTQKKIVVTTTTTTTYSGIKCMVNGYEINTDLKSAEAAGCH